MSDQPGGVDEQKAIVDDDQGLVETKQEKEQKAALEDFKKVRGGEKPSMRVKIHSPFTDYFDGPAHSISAVNATGPFDILPRHHNFISLLDPCDLIVRSVQQDERRIRISGGIMHVKADQVTVFLDV